MKNLMRMRMQGKEPNLIALNLTGKPLAYQDAYIAEPDGSVKSLYAANVVIVVDTETDHRGTDAILALTRLGVASMAFAVKHGNKFDFYELGDNGFENKQPEKRYGIYLESELKALAEDDWDELKDSPELLKTFAYLCASNKSQLEKVA